MLSLLILAVILCLGAIVLNVILIIQGFKDSIARGILALLAPLLLGGGLSGLYVIAHKAAIDEVGAKEVQKIGNDEFEKQKDELDDLENLQL
ncbi:MAG: hypothetical protein JXR91_12765 [Deltaproteobacteria bacterium]|nr:hypothetical protein [Deltaproteobacteria bacterium]